MSTMTQSRPENRRSRCGNVEFKNPIYGLARVQHEMRVQVQKEKEIAEREARKKELQEKKAVQEARLEQSEIRREELKKQHELQMDQVREDVRNAFRKNTPLRKLRELLEASTERLDVTEDGGVTLEFYLQNNKAKEITERISGKASRPKNPRKNLQQVALVA